jgi:hypothetical protein
MSTRVVKILFTSTQLSDLDGEMDDFTSSKMCILVKNANDGSLRGSKNACSGDDRDILYGMFRENRYISLINSILKDLYITYTHTMAPQSIREHSYHGTTINKGTLVNATRGVMELISKIYIICNALTGLSRKYTLIDINVGRANGVIGQYLM